MHILYFHQHFSTPNGSTATRSYEMSQALLQKGHKVTMICGSYSGASTGLIGNFVNGQREGEVDGINVIEFNLKYSNSNNYIKRSVLFLKFSFKGIILALTKNYDIIFATSTPLTAAIPGIFARWFRGKKFVFEVRDLWPDLPKAMGVITNPILIWAISLLELLAYCSAHRCIGLSPGIVDGIHRRGVIQEKIKMIPNGCDLNIFNSNANEWRPDDVSSDDFMAVFSGTHGVANGLNALIDVALELKKRDIKNIKLVLIGQGHLKKSYEQQALEMKLENIIFHSPVSKYKLSGLLRSADIGLQILANIPAFYYGTSPNKFFDYIAAGLPVLTNYPGWLSECILQNECGYVVQPQNATVFVDALEDASKNVSKTRLMGLKAKELAKSEFDRSKLANDWSHWVLGV